VTVSQFKLDVICELFESSDVMEVLKGNKTKEKRKSIPKTRVCWEFASYAMQGRRSNMEDCHCIVENLGGIKGDFFAAVFDGHSGDR
jgi:hypothetical protein